MLSQTGLWHFSRFSLKDDAVYKRLKQMPGDTLHRMFEIVTEVLMTGRPSAGVFSPLTPLRPRTGLRQ